MLSLLSCRAGGMGKGGVRSLTEPLCVKAWVVKAWCTLWRTCAALWCVWANPSLTQLAAHVHARRVGSASAGFLLWRHWRQKNAGTGHLEGACSEMFTERALSEDDGRLLLSQRSHQYQFSYLSTSYFWTKPHPATCITLSDGPGSQLASCDRPLWPSSSVLLPTTFLICSFHSPQIFLLQEETSNLRLTFRSRVRLHIAPRLTWHPLLLSHRETALGSVLAFSCAQLALTLQMSGNLPWF